MKAVLVLSLSAASSTLVLGCLSKSTTVEGGDMIVYRSGSTDAGAPRSGAPGSTGASGDEDAVGAPGETTSVPATTPDDEALEEDDAGDPAEGETSNDEAAGGSGTDVPSSEPSGDATAVEDDVAAGGAANDNVPTAGPEGPSSETIADQLDAGVDELEPSQPPETSADAGPSNEPPSPTDTGVPMTDHCAAVANWDALWVQFEAEVLLLVNQARTAGVACPEGDGSNPVEPVVVDEHLTCAARLHSLDMSVRAFYDHESPEGEQPPDRISDAGYDFTAVGENIAAEFETPEEVMTAWLAHAGYCTNIVNAQFTSLGVGYHPGDMASLQHLWTQNFGAPRTGGF